MATWCMKMEFLTFPRSESISLDSLGDAAVTNSTKLSMACNGSSVFLHSFCYCITGQPWLQATVSSSLKTQADGVEEEKKRETCVLPGHRPTSEFNKMKK